MKEGTVYRRFKARDGRDVTLRAMKWSDLDDALEFINSLVAEEADILLDTPKTREDEAKWVAGCMTAQENDKAVTVVAEVDGHLVGNSEVTPRAYREKHVGVLGISIKEGFRDAGIGLEMMRELETQALRLGLKQIILDVYERNSRARHVYEKAGYRVAGVTPNLVHGSWGYGGVVHMYKQIAPLGE